MSSSGDHQGERLRLRGHRFVSDLELELDFEGVGTADQTFVARRDPGEISVITFDEEFSRRFLGVPCLSVGHGYVSLVAQLFDARADHLPAGSEWRRQFDECRGAVQNTFYEE